MSDFDKKLKNLEKFIYKASAVAIVLIVLGVWACSSIAGNTNKNGEAYTEEVMETSNIYFDSYRLDKRISTGHVASYEYWFDYIKDDELYNIEISQLKVVEGSDKEYALVEDCDGADCHPLASKGTKHITLYTKECNMSLYDKFDFRNVLVEQ